ncbi:cyclic GMP-AMP synthase-like isoform X1 [Leopardus geoffroyi]|uniref:cyclic GMP-AMP synthase-like isoform X1 n=1 Tax=Leopardus geoffroyi TaxID=46844 RepID=UPI001E261946|nr:cyclic GMP-AMP synthase-like isoform X1 [Leopardus geoffroyi]
MAARGSSPFSTTESISAHTAAPSENHMTPEGAGRGRGALLATAAPKPQTRRCGLPASDNRKRRSRRLTPSRWFGVRPRPRAAEPIAGPAEPRGGASAQENPSDQPQSRSLLTSSPEEAGEPLLPPPPRPPCPTSVVWLLRALFLIQPCLACEDLNRHGHGCWRLVAASLVGL